MKCELLTCFKNASHTISSEVDRYASAICNDHLKEFKEGSFAYIIMPNVFEIKTIKQTKKPIGPKQTRFGEYDRQNLREVEE